MAKNLSSRPSKEAKEEALLGTHHGYTISLREAEPYSYNQKSVGQQYVIEGPKNEELIKHLKSAGARWDGYAKAWTIAKSKASKLAKVIEQLPEILAGQVQMMNKDIAAVQDLLRPLTGYKVEDKRWYNRIAVELSTNGTGLTIYADIGPRTVEKFVGIGCKQEKDQYQHKTFWLPLSKHQALRDLIERLPSIWTAWSEETRQQIAAVVGIYGAYSVNRGGQGLLVKGPYTEPFKDAMNSLRGYWDRGNQHWIIETAYATQLLFIMGKVEQWRSESAECHRVAEEQKESARKAVAAEREAEDQRVGRIYISERNVERGFQLPREIWREGKLYIFEKQTYAGKEYDDGDWMVSGTYLVATEEEQAKRDEEIRQRQQTRHNLKAAKSEIKEIASQVAQEQITTWPASPKTRLFDSSDRDPFCSIYLIDEIEGSAIVSFSFSDYSNDYTGAITEEQILRVKELASIIAKGGE